MICLDVFIDGELYGILNCSDDGDLPNGAMSNDRKIYTYWEDQFLDGGTAHIIEFNSHDFFNDEYKEYDYVVARTVKTGKYSSGKFYKELCASKAKDLITKEWQSAYGRKVAFKLSD